MSKSKSPRALQEVMTAVDAGHSVDGNVDIASSDSSKLLGSRRRRSTYNARAGGASSVRTRSAPADASFEFSGGAGVVQTRSAPTDASFEFSAAVVDNHSSASPASMVFSDGQLRAHQFPAVRSSVSSAGGGSKQPAMSPVRTSSIGSYSTAKQQAGVTAARSKKHVSFVTGGADKAAAAGKAGGGQGKKSGGLLGCCGPSTSRNEVVKPVARNDNRKVEAF